MAIPGNSSKNGDLVSFVEFEDVPKDATKQIQVFYTNAYREKNLESTSDVEFISRDSDSHDKREVISKVRKNNETEIDIIVSDYSVVQFGSDGKELKFQNCNVCNKNCYRSSDEENNEDTCKSEEVEADSHDYVDLSEHETKCSKMITSVLPVIPKRGCMNTFNYVLLIKELKDLQDMGDFEGHEQMVEKQMAKLRLAADPDMEVSLQIERAMALYFQNNIKGAKQILKLVVKQEQQLKNPGILVARALNLLTAIYKRQGKFGNAMKCVERANTCLEGQDSPDDKAELHHSYGALITAIPAAKDPESSRSTKKEAYKSYEMAGHYTANDEFKEYVHVKMAALMLESSSKAERIVTSLSKEDFLKAKKHLDFVEFNVGDNMALGTRIKLLLLRSDQYLCEDKVTMAMEKAKEANELIHRHDFQLEYVSAKKRIDYLSARQKKENEEWPISEYCSTNDNLTDSESAHSE